MCCVEYVRVCINLSCFNVTTGPRKFDLFFVLLLRTLIAIISDCSLSFDKSFNCDYLGLIPPSSCSLFLTLRFISHLPGLFCYVLYFLFCSDMFWFYRIFCSFFFILTDLICFESSLFLMPLSHTLHSTISFPNSVVYCAWVVFGNSHFAIIIWYLIFSD